MGLPNNLADAASAIKDGALGFFSEVKIGDLTVSALVDADAPTSLLMTRRPTEDGYDTIRAAISEPQILNWLVCLANPDYSVGSALGAALSGDPGSLLETWRDKKEILLTMRADREVFTAQSQEQIYDNMMIESIEPVYNLEENWDAYFCWVRMVEYRIVTSGVGGLLDQTKEAVGGL